MAQDIGIGEEEEKTEENGVAMLSVGRGEGGEEGEEGEKIGDFLKRFAEQGLAVNGDNSEMNEIDDEINAMWLRGMMNRSEIHRNECNSQLTS